MDANPKNDFSITVQELPAAIEALLFASGDPISLSRLEEVTGVDKEIIAQTIDRLSKEYSNNPWGGLSIRRMEDEYIMCTKPQMKSVLERYFQPRSRPPMSQATYETLAVIAYNQPVTRAQIEAVRGVSSDSIVSRLLERGWICECGSLDAPGRPTLFETTQQFLLEFGIESARELPALDLLMYQTIRDLEDSLEKAAGTQYKRQISIDNIASPDYTIKEEQNPIEDLNKTSLERGD
ncbi:MAG: SMC-Scp complex subunit ScpB [Clostridiaceae bacterium]|nr:SMC-Scp complex subunit ScpB [Clostridiaceae bacterium]